MRWHNWQNITNDCMTMTEQLCSTEQRHCGIFRGWRWQVITHKLFINLTSQRWGRRSCVVTLLFHRVWALQERARMDGADATCEKVDHIHGKKREFKMWLPYPGLFESPPRWPWGVPRPPKGHREGDMLLHHGISLLQGHPVIGLNHRTKDVVLDLRSFKKGFCHFYYYSVSMVYVEFWEIIDNRGPLHFDWNLTL